MNRPEDIPEDVWDDAGDLIDDWAIEFSIARAILAYGQRRADEAAARIAELEAEVERLRAQSETMRNILQEADKRIVWEHHGLGHDFTDRVEDVLND
jgi:hypothetical protein